MRYQSFRLVMGLAPKLAEPELARYELEQEPVGRPLRLAFPFRAVLLSMAVASLVGIFRGVTWSLLWWF